MSPTASPCGHFIRDIVQAMYPEDVLRREVSEKALMDERLFELSPATHP
jgi:hypothetical protein